MAKTNTDKAVNSVSHSCPACYGMYFPWHSSWKAFERALMWNRKITWKFVLLIHFFQHAARRRTLVHFTE